MLIVVVERKPDFAQRLGVLNLLLVLGFLVIASIAPGPTAVAGPACAVGAQVTKNNNGNGEKNPGAESLEEYDDSDAKFKSL